MLSQIPIKLEKVSKKFLDRRKRRNQEDSVGCGQRGEDARRRVPNLTAEGR